MIRLDKYLANLGLVSRRDSPALCKKWDVFVDGKIVKNADYKLSWWETITLFWQEIKVLENVYVILYKSAWYISSDEDEFWYPSYKKQIINCPYINLLHVAGRLDVDTEGLLLLSNDGQFIHQVISPRREKEKEYEVYLEYPISEENCKLLEEWVTLDDWFLTKPAKVEKINDKRILLTITEWKYHQVKRMLESVDNKVIYVKRLRIWKRNLEGLKPGEWKLINKDD